MRRFMSAMRRTLGVSALMFVLLVGADTYLAFADEPQADSAQAPEQVADDGSQTTPRSQGVSLRELKDRREPTPLHRRAMGALGIIVLIGIAVLLSQNRKRINWRPVMWGVGLQILFGLVVLSPTVGEFFFTVVNKSVTRLLSFAEEGADFLFQTVEPQTATTIDLDSCRPITAQDADGMTKDGFTVVTLPPQADAPADTPAVKLLCATNTSFYIGHITPALKTVAFWILPSIIFFSALMNILYHLGIMQFLVKAMAWVMFKTMGTSGSESLSAAANIFVGQTEAPLVVKPFIKGMTNSELNAVMVGGFATVAGGVLAAYVGFLKKTIPDIAGHLVVASIMSAPAALAIAKIMYPETEDSETKAGAELNVERPDVNVVEALARGSTEGLNLAVNVAAMLVAFVAMVALVNFLFASLGGLVGLELSLEGVLGWAFAPIAWCMGVPWDECVVVGRLFGEKMVLTELIAYMHLADVLKDPNALSYRSAVISSYALCGFANFASIGIQIGGIGGIAPERRTDLARIGMRAMFGGTIAALMTATIAGIIL